MLGYYLRAGPIVDLFTVAFTVAGLDRPAFGST
jgi:hypothetical protein